MSMFALYRCKPGKSKISKQKSHKSVVFQYLKVTRRTGTYINRSEQLHQRTATYSTRSSSLPLLTVPNPSTVFARRAFNYTALTTWSSLPADILTCDSESGFNKLKTHLFNNCLNVALLTHSQRLCSSAHGALHICFWYDMICEYRCRPTLRKMIRLRTFVCFHISGGCNCFDCTEWPEKNENIFERRVCF